jgi:hypothetical protein
MTAVKIVDASSHRDARARWQARAGPKRRASPFRSSAALIATRSQQGHSRRHADLSRDADQQADSQRWPARPPTPPGGGARWPASRSVSKARGMGPSPRRSPRSPTRRSRTVCGCRQDCIRSTADRAARAHPAIGATSRRGQRTSSPPRVSASSSRGDASELRLGDPLRQTSIRRRESSRSGGCLAGRARTRVDGTVRCPPRVTLGMDEQ